MVDRDDIKVTSIGAEVTVQSLCADSYHFIWNSSAKVGESMHQMFLINIIMAAYIVLCGLDISQV